MSILYFGYDQSAKKEQTQNSIHGKQQQRNFRAARADNELLGRDILRQVTWCDLATAYYCTI